MEIARRVKPAAQQEGPGCASKGRTYQAPPAGQLRLQARETHPPGRVTLTFMVPPAGALLCLPE
ncbi:hypothetical protein KSD_63670 [Ktedonobacter sp. SOSP1-85]|nr:hypothetical protein KSD_63670 [Ktedonobacter sp. SOSP1-85]